ncbi:unnamed protein product, partial [Polarella glacialis]
MPLPDLTLEQVLELQAELYCGFSEPSFQEQLTELEARVGKAYVRHCDEHTQLFSTVQNQLLPSYGFEEGHRGVLQMLTVGARFNNDETFRQNRALINELLGLAPAPSRAPLVTETLSWA